MTNKATTSKVTFHIPTSAIAVPVKEFPAWFIDKQISNVALFNHTGLPHKKSEAFRYSNLSQLTQPDLLANQPLLNAASKVQSFLPNTHRLVITQGVLDSEQSDLHAFKNDACQLLTLENALHDKILSKRLQTILSTDTDFNNQALSALNQALTPQSLVLVLGPSFICDQPIEIHYLQTQASCYTQLVVLMAQNSQATLIEHFYHTETDNTHSAWQQHIARIYLERDAQLNHYRLQTLPLHFKHHYSQDVHLHDHAQYRHFSLNMGATLNRHDIYTDLNASKALCYLQGITLGKNNQQHDTYIPLTHRAGYASSHQHFRQVLKDQSQGIFYSKVNVEKNCPKTEANQLSKSLLIGNKAQAFTRPELDILTDDVICSHGATIGALDEQSAYYIQSRGFSPEETLTLLMQAFLEELILDIPYPDIANIIRHHIQSWSRC